MNFRSSFFSRPDSIQFFFPETCFFRRKLSQVMLTQFNIKIAMNTLKYTFIYIIYGKLWSLMEIY